MSPPEVPTLPTRQEHLAKLRAASDEGTQFDLVIVGGGATGAGIALDAASRGLKVACVKRDGFSSGTSSKSTKLVHGGVRYLEKAVKELDYSQYTLVREALKERTVFLTIAPHLSMSLPIMLPIYQWWKAPHFWAGTKCYDLLAGKENLESSSFLARGKALEAFPMLRGSGLVGALVYYGKLVRSVGLAVGYSLTGFADGSHNDSRMNVAIALTAALYGATVVNHAEANELVKGPAARRITGVRVKGLLSGKSGDDFFFIYSLLTCDLGRSWQGVCTVRSLSTVRAKRHVVNFPLPSAQACDACPEKCQSAPRKLQRKEQRKTPAAAPYSPSADAMKGGVGTNSCVLSPSPGSSSAPSSSTLRSSSCS